MNNLKEPLNLEACKLGVPGFYHNQVSPLSSQDLPGGSAALYEENIGQL